MSDKGGDSDLENEFEDNDAISEGDLDQEVVCIIECELMTHCLGSARGGRRAQRLVRDWWPSQEEEEP